jgi:hypothetical protein
VLIMSSTPVSLPTLRGLVDEGFNSGVLALLEHRAMAQAVAMREVQGHTVHTSEQVRGLANELLPPKGSMKLYQLYTETAASMSRQPVEDLEEVSRNLSTCANALEGQAAKTLATAKGLPLDRAMSLHSAVAERYAELLQAARALESAGHISVTQQGRLANLSTRPSGPLSAFFDKAESILQSRQVSSARMRMLA